MPSSVIMRSSISSAEIAFRRLAIGRKITLAEPTPISVAMNAAEIDGPSAAGAARFWSTCTRPSTVPMMPIVGAKPPAFSNGAAEASWRAAIPSTSASRIACTISGSVPSTTSCRALRVKGSSISDSIASSASSPSRRALSARDTSWSS
jgi:hypothetical protein